MIVAGAVEPEAPARSKQPRWRFGLHGTHCENLKSALGAYYGQSPSREPAVLVQPCRLTMTSIQIGYPPIELLPSNFSGSFVHPTLPTRFRTCTHHSVCERSMILPAQRLGWMSHTPL